MAEKQFNKDLAQKIEVELDGKVKVILPQERALLFIEKSNGLNLIFKDCLEMIDLSDMVVCILDGSDADSGTSFEVGYAYGKKPILGIRTDFRELEEKGVNLMLSNSCSRIILDSSATLETLAIRISSVFYELCK